MSAHSPGPWYLHIYAADFIEINQRNGTPVIVAVGNIKEADAHLIAAAPDLLRLARYSAQRGEGCAEMAREILARIDGAGHVYRECECDPTPAELYTSNPPMCPACRGLVRCIRGAE